MNFTLDPRNIRDLAPDVIDADGLPRVMPASYYASTTPEERALLGHRYGLYGLPTIELCDWLTEFIGGRNAVEIGAGNGAMAAHMGIPATDAMLQQNPDVQAIYELMAQPLITFGPNVRRLEASDAVRVLRPQVVIGSWITHRFDKRRPSLEGNMFGPRTDWILERVEHYVLIGNESVHANNPLLKTPHETHHFDFLYSRAMNGSQDFVGIWEGRAR